MIFAVVVPSCRRVVVPAAVGARDIALQEISLAKRVLWTRQGVRRRVTADTPFQDWL